MPDPVRPDVELGRQRGWEDARKGEYNDTYDLVAPLDFLEGYQQAWDIARPGWTATHGWDAQWRVYDEEPDQ